MGSEMCIRDRFFALRDRSEIYISELTAQSSRDEELKAEIRELKSKLTSEPSSRMTAGFVEFENEAQQIVVGLRDNLKLAEGKVLKLTDELAESDRIIEGLQSSENAGEDQAGDDDIPPPH